MSFDINLIEEQLGNVQTIMSGVLSDSKISKLVPAGNNIIGSGKMLRARLVLAVGGANNIALEVLENSAAAVEIIHGASLLHDDVIDGGILRRSAPTFWKKHGINGAILLGDLLVFKGLNLLVEANRSDLLQEMIDMSTQVCRSEVEQELLLRGSPGTWEECEKIARTKTGSLFAFSAVAGATDAPGQVEALREAGFMLGTAYQLADDVLDASGFEEISGKTLGRDAERGKTTAITATKNAPSDPIEYIYELLRESTAKLAEWPIVQDVWELFLNVTMKPVLSKHLAT